ncbi:cytochrome P450 family protein [Streptomyces sp. NPDC003011]
MSATAIPGDGDLFEFNIDVMQDPHPVYARMREEQPVQQALLPTGMKVWIVTRHADVREVMSNPLLSKDVHEARRLLDTHAPNPASKQAFGRMLGEHMLNTDPPDHTRLRKLIAGAFTNRQVEKLRPGIVKTADDLLDRLAGRDEFELINDYAFPLPLAVICELLGVPEADRADFQRWSYSLVTDSATIGLASDEGASQSTDDAASLTNYLLWLLGQKRTEPADDMLTMLVQAKDEKGMLSESELVSMAFLTLVAGHETTVNLIGNGMLALLRNPDQLAALRADPKLYPGAVEEFLRYDGPGNTAMMRHSTEPVEVGGTLIPAGEFVLAVLTSANRDGARFTDPDRLDVTRPVGGHVGFGHGIHYCVGAPLARLEGEIAFERLLTRFPDLAPAGDLNELRWRFSTLIRGLDVLPLRPHRPQA